MAKSRRSEAISHALIVSALAGAAFAAEWAQEAIPELFQQWSLAIRLLLLAIVMAAVFMLVVLLETYLKRAAGQEPIHIERVGLIDGYWINGVWKIERDRWKMIGASVIHIASAGADGFTLEGEYFKGGDGLGGRGHFAGTGHLAGSGFVYTYDGDKGTAADRGVGYYEFHKSVVGRQKINLRGFFVSAGLDATRRVEGRKLSKAEEATLAADQEPLLIREFLAEMAEAGPDQSFLRHPAVAVHPDPVARGGAVA